MDANQDCNKKHQKAPGRSFDWLVLQPKSKSDKVWINLWGSNLIDNQHNEPLGYLKHNYKCKPKAIKWNYNTSPWNKSFDSKVLI